MTREEARDFLYKKIKSYSGKIEINKELVDLIKVDELISKIYSDFENRICKNCKYLIKTKRGLLCSNPINYDYIITDKSFGCNKFERRESETQYNSDYE